MQVCWLRGAVAVLPLLGCLACETKDGTQSSDSGGSSATNGAAAGTGSVVSTGGLSGVLGGAGGSAAMGGGESHPGASGGTGGAASTGDAFGGAAGGSASGGVTSAAAGGTGGVAGGMDGSAGRMQQGGADGAGAGAGGGAASGGAGEPISLTIFDKVVFYDAYARVVDEPVPAGVQRLRNDLFTHRLSDAELDSIQSTLKVRVVIGALCDNYDRIGSVALALVPKAQSTYKAEDVQRIEIGRYITPFMDRNRQPSEVPYEYHADHLVPVLHDLELRAQFNLWLELELFGVPYAANEEVAGCANRADVFRGTLILDSDSSRPAPRFDQLIPIAYKQPFNNYQQGATDKLGETRRTLEFTLGADSADTQLVLITSNHGANSGGEEYTRRDHFLYVDEQLQLSYKPGRSSCEPFRKYNTQANGIYGSSPRSDSAWQSFSNWCPGDVIDTRIIPLGPLSAGAHQVVIDVPGAAFAGKDGNFPLSLYAQSRQ